MNSYHCLNCGEKLKQLNAHEWIDKYKCPKCGTEWYKCGTEWYRVRGLIIEWVENKKEVEHDV